MKASEKTQSLAAIRTFFECTHFAVAGASRDPKKFGNMIFKEMVKKGYDVLPVNSNANEIEGRTCYPALKDLPESVDALVIVTQPHQTRLLLKEALDKGIRNIWILPGAEDIDVLAFCMQNQGNFITGRCILMFLEPVSGFHWLHRFFYRLFGSYPN